MAEINITRLFTGDVDTWPLSGSVATHGANASRSTWANALAQASDTPFLNTEADLDALRDHMRGYGAWDRDEIAGWDAQHCNALFLQLVAGDMREGDLDGVEVDDDVAWAEYEERASEGSISGNIGRGWSDAAGMLYNAAIEAGWFTYCGVWFHPVYLAESAYGACDASGCIPACDAVYYSLSD